MKVNNEKELINLMLKQYMKDALSESPYSSSMYICESEEATKEIKWSSKPNNHIRLSDHWNFTDEFGEKHCKLSTTDEYVSNTWLACEWDNEDKYIPLFEISRDTISTISRYFGVNSNNSLNLLLQSIRETKAYLRKYKVNFENKIFRKITIENINNIFDYNNYLEETLNPVMKKVREYEAKKVELKKEKELKVKQIEYLTCLYNRNRDRFNNLKSLLNLKVISKKVLNDNKYEINKAYELLLQSKMIITKLYFKKDRTKRLTGDNATIVVIDKKQKDYLKKIIRHIEKENK